MESDKPKIKISAEVRQRRKEIREQAKAMLLGQVLSHPYFPHDIYINECESWIIINESIWNEFLVHSVSDNIPNIQKKKDL